MHNTGSRTEQPLGPHPEAPGDLAPCLTAKTDLDVFPQIPNWVGELFLLGHQLPSETWEGTGRQLGILPELLVGSTQASGETLQWEPREPGVYNRQCSSAGLREAAAGLQALSTAGPASRCRAEPPAQVHGHLQYTG